MEYSLFDQLLIAYQYNDSWVHNLFLTIIYFILAWTFFYLVRAIFKRLAFFFKKDKQVRPQSIIKSLFVSMTWWVFPVLMFTVLTVALDGASSTKVIDYLLVKNQSEMTYYTLLEKYKANETGQYERGSTSIYISSMSLNKFTKNWQKKVRRGGDSNARILGETAQTIYYHSGKELGAVNKKTGKSVLSSKAITEENPELKERMTTNSQKYQLAAKDNLLYLETNLGDQYQLNLKNLKATKLSENLIDFELPEESSYLNHTNLPLSIAANSPAYPFFIFLTTDFINQVSQFKEDGQSFNIRDDWRKKSSMYLYGLGVSEATSQLSFTKILDKKLISPCFMAEKTSDKPNPYTLTPEAFKQMDQLYLDQKSEQIITLPQADFSGVIVRTFLSNYTLNSEGITPFLIDDKGLLILHYANLEPRSSVLVSRLDLETHQLTWTIDTKTPHLRDYQLVDNQLVMTQSANGGSEQLLVIDLETGTGKGYDLKYNKKFSVSHLDY